MVVGGAGGGIRTEKSNGGILQCGGEKDREKSNWWRLSAGYKGATFCVVLVVLYPRQRPCVQHQSTLYGWRIKSN